MDAQDAVLMAADMAVGIAEEAVYAMERSIRQLQIDLDAANRRLEQARAVRARVKP